MPELRGARLGWIGAAIGLLATLAAGWQSGVAAACALVIAQAGWASAPALADHGGVAKALLRALGSRAWVWTCVLALAALLVAWPLSALLRNGSIWAALGVALAAWGVLLAAWRGWTAWGAPDVDARHAFARASAERSAVRNWRWRGLQPAVAVVLVAALVIAIAWPGLLVGQSRWIAAAVAVLAFPLLHRLMRVSDKAALEDGLTLAEATQRAPVALPAQARNAIPVALHELPELQRDDVAASTSFKRVQEEASADADAVVDLPATAGSPELDAELYAAARAGRVERAIALLDAGARADALPAPKDRDQRRLPLLAAVLPDLRLLRELILRGVSLDADETGLTPLLAATRDSWHGRPDAVAMLLANGADVRATDADGNTALHHAARSTDPGVAALLLDAHADIDAANAAGQAPLGMACTSGNWRLAKFLLERGAAVSAPGGGSALLSAAMAEDDDPAGVQLLLRHKAAVDGVDGVGRSALHLAAEAGHSAIVQTLLDGGARAELGDAQGITALMLAAQGGHRDSVDALLESGADVAVVDAQGADALRYAVEGEVAGTEVVQRLLDAGAHAETEDASGVSTLVRARQLGRWAIVQCLEPGFAPPPQAVAANASSGDAATASASELEDVRPPYAVVSDALLARDLPTAERFVTLLDRAQVSRLLAELAPRAPHTLPWLLRHGADVDATRDGHSVLAGLLRQAPADANATDSLRQLFARGASPAGAGVFAGFLNAARVHAFEDGETFALSLLERGADPFAPEGGGDTPLHHAIRLRWPRLRDRLLALGVDPNGLGMSGFTPLHVATACEDAATVRALVAAGAQPGLRAPDGLTPLGIALANGGRDLAGWLDWRGWTFPGRPLRASDLPAAAMAGDADAVQRLMDLGFPLDSVDGQGCTALLRAAGGGHLAVIGPLLARGARVDIAATTGATPLSAAVSMRHAAVVDRLLAAGAELEQRLPGDVTVLMLASALGLPEMVTRLLRAGADVNAADPQGLAPIHCAALYGFTSSDRARLVALFDTLLLSGADANATAGAGITPLLLLLGARAEPGTACHEAVIQAGLERLFDEDIRLDVQDPRGFGPLHIAALHGLMAVVRRLRDRGAPLSQRDRLNRSPREIALMRGFVDVAAELAEPAAPGSDASASMARFLRPQDRDGNA